MVPVRMGRVRAWSCAPSGTGRFVDDPGDLAGQFQALLGTLAQMVAVGDAFAVQLADGLDDTQAVLSVFETMRGLAVRALDQITLPLALDCEAVEVLAEHLRALDAALGSIVADRDIRSEIAEGAGWHFGWVVRFVMGLRPGHVQ